MTSSCLPSHLGVNRAGIALTGLIVLLAGGALQVADVQAALELPTLMLLFALMILMLCMAMRERGLDPRSFLLALVGSAGSAASLIGNPQNILIGELRNLDFFDYSLTAAVPAIAGLGIVFAVTAVVWRKSFRMPEPSSHSSLEVEIHPWLTVKRFLATLALISLMVLLDSHREVAALGVAAVLILGRGVATRALFSQVDWSLLVLIAGPFIMTALFFRYLRPPN
jgi:Na+/H+ antiporter NhaD/arsenite permease-like protein